MISNNMLINTINLSDEDKISLVKMILNDFIDKYEFNAARLIELRYIEYHISKINDHLKYIENK